MALSPSTAATDFATAHSTVTKTSRTAVVDAFVNTYVAHAKRGTCKTIKLSASGKTKLKAKLMTFGTSSTANIKIFAQALVAFWSAEKTPLSPAFDTFVSNDASTKQAAFETAIRTSISTNISNASIKEFFVKTDAVVNNIIYKSKLSTLANPVVTSDSVV